ncbi:MarR family transcriptional regulator [Novacetimonas hansenii]|uniref:MarR family transcriptional regulator n=2 Tax=Novacetimonas hansenii TaxID=436 RepID=A0AAW5EWY0_NOVHA|nr:MarR family transcriptional regulator [Novacetimonas hansenii]EFG85971.1 putative transcriptional regulator [Novacetimonas hansenii ATCC 23769]MBL7237474.1 MarR family transcriptional regulator [Novacetimonas hansenii]MCJ8354790.1 MarR family transcriptional regulator [Novacetimonas hansenii]PYD72161.1 transcriptional regulator [Novacetimonas hansenii]QOF95404.1 MarR family transcriptional regulator [Novacetimonas hansenii]
MADTERLERERSFRRRLARLGTAWRRQVDHDLRDYGLTEATWRPVLYLGLLMPPVRQTDLARALEIEAPSVARLLDVLERRGLVFRSRDEEDRRSKLVRLTQEGERIERQVRDAVDAVSHRLLSGISDSELTACYSVFDRIEANLYTDRMATGASVRS